MTRHLRLAAPLSLALLALHADAAETACPADAPCTAAATNAAPRVAAGAKQLWADSHLFADAPPPDVRAWLTDKPETDGKFLVVEFWRTWCGACKRMTPLMNTLQQKYGSELAVIGITGETEEAVKAYAGPKKTYFQALDKARPPEQVAAGERRPDGAADAASAQEPDTSPCRSSGSRAGEQGAYEARFGVWGWPHVVILEPLHRTVVWEGFPGQKGHELTEAKVERILAIGRAMKAEAAAEAGKKK